MKVGDKVTKTISRATLHGEKEKKATGTVIYIHPKGRFYRVRFDFGGRSFVEAFPMEGGSLYDD